MKRVVIDIRASKDISGLVKVTVTSPAGLMKFFLNVEPCATLLFVVGMETWAISGKLGACTSSSLSYTTNLAI